MKQPIIFGHRGASAEEPENTLRAFKKAFLYGAGGIEFDVQSCGSGEIVIIHDQKVDRTSNGNGFVKDYSYQELLKFDFGKQEKIPLLEDVLKLYGNDYWLNIEIKEVGIEKQVFELLQKYSISKKTVVSSFHIPALKAMRKLDNEIEIAFLYDFNIDDLPSLLQEVNVNSIHPGKELINKEIISTAHELKLTIRSWTIDDTIMAKQFAIWGIDGIITNKPKEIIQRLQPKNS
ncbi:MAG: glycerophosphodiester phosphodiesterase [Candidatus Thorarchaeota archaeon]